MVYFQCISFDRKTPSSMKLTVNLKDFNETGNDNILKITKELPTFFNSGVQVYRLLSTEVGGFDSP